MTSMATMPALLSSCQLAGDGWQAPAICLCFTRRMFGDGLPVPEAEYIRKRQT